MTPTTTIPERMRASVLTAPLTLSIEDVPTPPMESDEVLVEVAAVGVCGSDTHYYRHGRIGDFVVTSPLILGHELLGRIDAVRDDDSLLRKLVVAAFRSTTNTCAPSLRARRAVSAAMPEAPAIKSVLPWSFIYRPLPA
jgi:threonine dehydrogenase-like Zn-dependent dehydrogenase